MSDTLAIEGGDPVREDFLLWHRPFFGEEEEKEIIDTLRSGWITTGPKTVKFEEAFKKYIGSKYAIGVNSCTAGLHLSLVALGIGEGDEVITTPMTFAASANVVIHQRAKPIFVDIERDTLNIDPNLIEEKITPRTKAILIVHFGGHPCAMDEIMAIARKYNLAVIEDAAHALEAEYKGQKIGAIGDAGAFSFYANKNITTAEGGMVTTSNSELADKITILRLHGLSRDAWKRFSAKGSTRYEVVLPGYKYNLTDLQSSLGLHQLAKVDQFYELRCKYAKIYDEALKDVEEITLFKPREGVKHAYHLYIVSLNLDQLRVTRDEFTEALKAENIGTTFHFPLHLHPYYQETYGFKRGDFPVAEWAGDSIFYLPLYPKMTEKDQEDVITAVKKLYRAYSR